MVHDAGAEAPESAPAVPDAPRPAPTVALTPARLAGVAAGVLAALVAAFFAGGSLMGAAPTPAPETPGAEPPAQGPLAASQEPPGDWVGGPTAINLGMIYDLGCATDLGSLPDLGVRVYLDGRLVLERQAMDDGHPLLAALALVEPRPDSHLTVAAFDQGDDQRPTPCDVDPGPGLEATVPWDGSPRKVVLRGNTAVAAEVHLVLGRAPPAPTNVTVEHADGEALVSWHLPQDPDAVLVAHGGAGRVIEAFPGTQRSVTFTDLCDNSAYAYRVLARYGEWSIPAEVAFQTPDRPPPQPFVLEAMRSGDMLRVAWEVASVHDVARFDVHVGPPGFVPTESSKVASENFPWSRESAYVRTSLEGVVRIVAVDKGGLTSVSDEFAIGAPERFASFESLSCPPARR